MPVLADVLQDTWTMDPLDVERLITPRTKAIMPVHLYGQPADLTSIGEIAKKHKLYVIEDTAEALGSLYNGRHVGSFGDAAAFSFFGNKMITTGEGGMVTFRDWNTADRAARLRDHGMDPNQRYWHIEVGYNYRLTNLQAAIGVAQLEDIESKIQRKLEIAANYRRHLEPLQSFQLPVERQNIRNTYWLFSMIIHSQQLGLSRDEFVKRLQMQGVETRPLFYPLHTMPPYKNYGAGRTFPNAERLSKDGISLPSSISLSDHEISHICQTIANIVAACKIQNYIKNIVAS
jgi:perosamine synthetase